MVLVSASDQLIIYLEFEDLKEVSLSHPIIIALEPNDEAPLNNAQQIGGSWVVYHTSTRNK